MATRDMHSNVELKQLLKAATVSTDQTSSGLDMRNFESAEFLMAVGQITNVANSPQPSWTFKLQESDDDSTYTDVTDSDVVLTGSAQSPVEAPDSSTGVFLTVDAAAEDDETYRVGYIGTKRYARVVATANNTPGNTPLWIGGVKGTPLLTPTQDS